MGTGMILIRDFPKFLFDLGPPLGFDEDEYVGNIDLQDKFIGELNLSTYNNFKEFNFYDVMEALSLNLLILKNVIEKQLHAIKSNDSEFDKEKVELEVREGIIGELEEMKENDDNIVALSDLNNRDI
jgi:hypothetical protein